MDVILKNLNELFQSIEINIDRKLFLPSLLLIYTTIDILASLEKREPNEKVAKRFVKWVDHYMLKNNSLPCNSLDLYSARCGLLHTYSADSDLSNRSRARRVIYAWGVSKAGRLQEANDKLDSPDDVAIHISELFESLKSGKDLYFAEINNDIKRKEVVMKNTTNWFSNLNEETLNQFLLKNKGK